MTGRVDDDGRALVRITVKHPTSGASVVCEGWVDTACTAELVLTHVHIAALGLQRSATVRAEIADGSTVVLDTYTCLIDWFGEMKQVEAVANPGPFPLVGVGLLREHQLTVDYRAGTMSID